MSQDCTVFRQFLTRVILTGAFHVARAVFWAWLHALSSTAQHSVSTPSSEQQYLLQSATRSSVWSSCRTEPDYTLECYIGRKNCGKQYCAASSSTFVVPTLAEGAGTDQKVSGPKRGHEGSSNQNNRDKIFSFQRKSTVNAKQSVTQPSHCVGNVGFSRWARSRTGQGVDRQDSPTSKMTEHPTHRNGTFLL